MCVKSALIWHASMPCQLMTYIHVCQLSACTIYYPTKCMNQHAIYQCNMPACSMQTCSMSMQTCNMPACSMSIQTCNMSMQPCNMPACSMSTYSMQWLNMCLPTYAVCQCARCQCTALTTCIHIGRGTSIYLERAPNATPLHTWQLFWFT